MIRVDQLEHKGIHYLLCYPKDYQEGKRYPVMFHLHGAGGRGVGFKEFGDSNILKMIVEKADSPLSKGFCVIPQCGSDTWFDHFSELLSLCMLVYNAPYTDKNRFNGSGISMGGYGIYQVMISLPDLFNKAIVCCGGGMYWDAFRMKNIHIRIFHGKNDEVVFPEEAKRMFTKLKDVGADAELTIYPDCDHNCWDKTYSNYELLEWFFD